MAALGVSFPGMNGPQALSDAAIPQTALCMDSRPCPPGTSGAFFLADIFLTSGSVLETGNLEMRSVERGYRL